MSSHETKIGEGTLTPLFVETARKSCRFFVEVAYSADDRERGLMNRHELQADRGMLFVHDGEQAVSFWMKNTYIPLDIIFIGAGGVIRRVAINVMPHSPDAVSSYVPVLAVLEVRAGTVLTHDIRAGDRVRHAVFDNAP